MKHHLKKIRTRPLSYTLFLTLTLTGCMSAAEHRQELGDAYDKSLTLGLVQKEVQVGLPQSQVAVALGSPNIVTRDSNNQETWVYDKIASEASFSQDNGSASGNFSGQGLILPSTTLSGNLGGSYNKMSGAASITQRTLTVIVKFNGKNQVDSVSYHSTKF